MEITVAGLPVRLYYDANGAIVRALFQTVTYNGAPLIVTFDPPVATIEQINLMLLVNALAAAILNGATIG